jgi:hypothetical protein
MIVNNSKRKEIVFRRPNPCQYVDVMPLLGIEQVKEVKLLAVIISSNLCFDLHVDFIKQSTVSAHIY